MASASTTQSGEYQKFTYWDPYQVMLSVYLHGLCTGDTTGLQPEKYFGQLDSLGITAANTWGDSLASHNPWGVKIIGQDNSIKVSGKDVAHYVRTSHNIYSEAEWHSVDTMNGAWFATGEGEYYDSSGTSIGWFCDPNEHSADTVLDSRGPKWGVKWSLDYIRFRLVMKVWDVSTTDTICTWTIKHRDNEVWVIDTFHYVGTDFTTANQWKTFNLPYLSADGWYGMQVKLYWYGDDSLAIDKVEMVANGGDWLEDLDGDDLDTALESYHSRIDTSNHLLFAAGDEPHPAQFWGNAFWDDHTSAVAPYRRQAPALRWNTPYWAYEVDPSVVITDEYAITAEHDSATNNVATGSGRSIQTAYSTLVSWIQERTSATVPEGVELWQVIQCGKIGEWNRDPTTNEMKVQVYLTLVHGCTGVGYFTYSQLFSGDCEEDGMFGHFDPGISEFPPDESKSSPIFNGLVDWNFDSLWYEVNDRWDAVKDAHEVVDSVWLILDTLTWQGSDSWDDVAYIDGSIIDSIYSTTFDEDSTYIDVGRFTSGDGYEYYALLNRRSLSSDSQDVVIQLEDLYGGGVFYDVYEDTTYLVEGSSGNVSLTVHFDPAELKVFRIAHGYCGTHSGTWSSSNRYEVVGDITVSADSTLTIESTNVVLYEDDVTRSGADSTQTEFIVNDGTLRIDGTSGSRVALAPEYRFYTNYDGNWYGIRVTNGGHLFCDNAIIKYAYAGIYIEDGDVDTITYTRVEDCAEYGIRMANNEFFLNRDTIYTDGKTDYGLWADSTTDTSVFWNSLIDGPEYGARFDDADVDIEATDFTTSDYHGSGNRYAISPYNGSYIKVDDGEIVNYTVGLLLDDDAEVLIDSCHFYSDIFYQGDSSSPGMRDGIKGEDGDATCKVRRSCFEIIDDVSVLRALNGSDIDLGNYSDSGWNEFWTEKFFSPPKTWLRRPDYSVNNVYGNNDTVTAVGNYWGTNNLNIGNVDDSIPMVWREPYCRATGGGAKLAEETTADELLPLVFHVSQNYPNPFNANTVIAFTLPEPSYIRIDVYNILGQKVITLMDQQLPAGHHSAEWSGVNAAGHPVSSGVYLYRLKSGDRVVSRKMLLMK